MDIQQKRTGLHSLWSLLLVVMLTACGSDSSDGRTVAVNLSLITDSGQADHHVSFSRLFAWFERWVAGATPAWAQSVTDITRIHVEITGPGIGAPVSTDVPVADPTRGKEIPVTIQAPVGPNRTITVSASNSANTKIFGGTLPNVNLTAGAPIDLVIPLVRLFTVSVEKRGNGSGSVISTPPGIDCGPTCLNQSGQFEAGTEVSLTAPAVPGSAFAGWSGDCSGMNDCVVRGEARVIAQFMVPVSTNHLHVDRGGTGGGTVTSQPSGISCGTSCDADFVPGTIVTLTASPTAGSTFTNWSGGGCSGGVPTCDVVMNVNQNVAAIFSAFVPPPMSTLTVQKSGVGAGTVTSAPSGIDCGRTCSAQFPTDNTVRLTASPASGSTFVGWTGACTGLSCTVTMETNKIVSAQFDLLPVFVTLTVNTSGPGNGTVTSVPAGIVCEPVCAFSYLAGTTVRLTATASGGSVFAGWRGAICDAFGNAPCDITMNDNITVNARFEAGGGGG